VISPSVFRRRGLFPYPIGLGRRGGRCPERRLRCFKGANIFSGQCRAFTVTVVRLFLLLSVLWSKRYEPTPCPAKSDSFLTLDCNDTWLAVSSVLGSIESSANSCSYLTVLSSSMLTFSAHSMHVRGAQLGRCRLLSTPNNAPE